MALDGSFALFQPLLHERGDKIGGMMAQLKAQAFLVRGGTDRPTITQN